MPVKDKGGYSHATNTQFNMYNLSHLVYEATQWHSQQSSLHDYLIDSGASCHITSNDTDLVSIEIVDMELTVAESSVYKSAIYGTLILKIQGLLKSIEMHLKE